MLRHLRIAATILCWPMDPALAQDTPEAAAQAFGEAMKANDWAAAARMMHPRALQQLRSLFEPILGVPGAEQLGVQLFGVHSNAELASTPDTVMFANFLRTVLSQQEGLADALRTATVSPLGHVNGGADTVLVVSRMELTIEGMTISQFEVMPFIRDGGRWWGLLKVDFTNMAAMLQRRLGARRS